MTHSTVRAMTPRNRALIMNRRTTAHTTARITVLLILRHADTLLLTRTSGTLITSAYDRGLVSAIKELIVISARLGREPALALYLKTSVS